MKLNIQFYIILYNQIYLLLRKRIQIHNKKRQGLIPVYIYRSIPIIEVFQSNAPQRLKSKLRHIAKRPSQRPI